MWQRRARHWQRMGGKRPWPGPRGFGCLFGLVFLIVAGSLVAVVATLLSFLGPLLALIIGAAFVIVLFVMGRTLFLTARALDRLVEVTGRVESGDYSVPRSGGQSAGGLPIVGQLTGGFDTMVARLKADEEHRRTLLADVSHELRTPLAVITGNLEAILDGVYPADSAHLSPILEETRVMERLIEDLRTIALSEGGTLALHPEPTDPDLLIGEVLRAFTPAAAAAGVTLATETEGDLPILDLDPVRIREVLSNLVANALHHTPSGGTVSVGGSTTASVVSLTVRDTGPGVDPALLPHIFDRFVKGTGSRGSGLGLAIARGLVEAHGGTIKVASAAGGGTTFRVDLPRTPDE
jgi:signal transduction histidine kinase